MANPIIVKLISSLLEGKIPGNVNSFKSGNGKGHFFDILKDLHASNNCTVHKSKKSGEIKTAANNNNKGYKYYLESFKKELLAQGKSLNTTLLDKNDLPLIKTFLLQCGFSVKKAEQFLKDLKTDDPNGKISLSQIFHKLTELGSPKIKKNRDERVELTAIPYIESILKDFNFRQKELDSIFSNSKVKNEGLDLNKLVAKLKEFKGQRPIEKKASADQKLSQQILKKMEKIGLSIPNNEKPDQITLKDFIASLEQVAEKVGKDKIVSTDINNTLGKILNKVESSEQKSESTSTAKVSASYHFTESLLKGEINTKGRPAFYDKAKSSFDKNKTDKNESISSLFKQKGAKVQSYVGSKAATKNYSGKAELLSNLNRQTESVNPVKVRGFRVDAAAGDNNIIGNSEALNFSNALKTVEHGEQPIRDYLPTSIINQVGKQISKSILRGDRLVTLQLKPPDLGTVKIKMEIKDHTLKLGMIAENHSVKELLLNNVHELKEALIQHGVKLEKVDVQINYNFGQSLNASKERSDNGQSWGKDFNGKGFLSDDQTEGLQERPINIMSRDKLLDLVA
jgi:flagellar hook-length control protein FliK